MPILEDDTIQHDQSYRSASHEYTVEQECISSEDGHSEASSTLYKILNGRAHDYDQHSSKFRGFRNPTGVRKAAQDLQPHVPEADLVKLAVFLTSLGKVGAGLREALRVNTAIGNLFRLFYNLNEAAESAVVNQPNCLKLAGLGKDILQLIDLDGRHRIAWGDETIRFLSTLCEEAVLMVDGYSKPGWLLRAVCNERMKEDFESMHRALADVVQTQRLDWGSAQPLPLGDYFDEAKAVRRLLKQLGEGSVSEGLHRVGDQQSSLMQLAELMGTKIENLQKELKSLPSQDVDVDIWYANIMDESAELLEPEDEPANHFMELFTCYDKNESNALEFEEFLALLTDSGLLNGKRGSEATEFAYRHFEIAATDGQLTFNQFVRLYDTLLTRNGAQQLRFYFTPQQQEDLKNIFYRFAAFGTRQANVKDIDGPHFLKLCKDCNLLDQNLTSTDVDIVFAKVKEKGQRRIKYPAFLTALTLLSERKGVTFDSFVRKILSAEGPVAAGTKADFVRFHDDKSSYTGVYARGGPTMKDGFTDWSEIVDRSKADVRGVKQTTKVVRKVNPANAILEPTNNKPPMGLRTSVSRAAMPNTPRGAHPPLANIRTRSSSPAPVRHWNSPSTPSFSATIRPPSQRRSSMYEFGTTPRASEHHHHQHPFAPDVNGHSNGESSVSPLSSEGGTGLPPFGNGHGEPEKPLLRRVRRMSTGDSTSSLPRASFSSTSSIPTQPLNGPLRCNIQPRAPRAASASPRTSRRLSDPAFLRGSTLRTPTAAEQPEQTQSAEVQMPPKAPLPPSRRASDSSVFSKCSGTSPAQELYAVFERFAMFGLPATTSTVVKKVEMDGMRFAKLWRDSGLLQGNLTTTTVDLIFTKVKAKGERKITFRQFKCAVELVAAELGTVPTDIMQVLLLMDGPINSGTRPDEVRFHSDRTQASGHAHGAKVHGRPMWNPPIRPEAHMVRSSWTQ